MAIALITWVALALLAVAGFAGLARVQRYADRQANRWQEER